VDVILGRKYATGYRQESKARLRRESGLRVSTGAFPCLKFDTAVRFVPPKWRIHFSERFDEERRTRREEAILSVSTVATIEPATRTPRERDELIRSLYAEHAGPLLAFTLGLTGGDRHRAE